MENQSYYENFDEDDYFIFLPELGLILVSWDEYAVLFSTVYGKMIASGSHTRFQAFEAHPDIPSYEVTGRELGEFLHIDPEGVDAIHFVYALSIADFRRRFKRGARHVT